MFKINNITDDQPANASITTGTVVLLTVAFNADVNVSGSPTLTLSDGGTATYVQPSAGSTQDATFTYTVLAGQTTSDLTVTAISNTSDFTTTGNLGQTIPLTPPSSYPISLKGEDQSVICFMAGTSIRTPSGDVAVESLQRGDLVLSFDGRALPVSWMGRQTVSTRFADKLRVLPIRIKAGALDENVPARDLLVSPDHAMLVDGALIHAGALVNGGSIVRESNVPQVFTYYHVEVDDHSLILAENAPAETFVDNVDRLAFDNWDEHLALLSRR